MKRKKKLYKIRKLTFTPGNFCRLNPGQVFRLVPVSLIFELFASIFIHKYNAIIYLETVAIYTGTEARLKVSSVVVGRSLTFFCCTGPLDSFGCRCLNLHN